jgi:predicted AAA+ superfamily ATPase
MHYNVIAVAEQRTGDPSDGKAHPFSDLSFFVQRSSRGQGVELDESYAIKEKQGLILHYLNDYLKTGGYPEVVLKKVESPDYLRLLVESILFKDVAKRYNISFSKKMYDLALYLISNHSTEISSSRLKNILDFKSVHTVENYLSYLEEAFLVFTVRRFSFKLKEQLRTPRKVYVYDNGVINVYKFKISPDTVLFVITWDDEREEKHKNLVIHFIPLWKWLVGVLTIPG